MEIRILKEEELSQASGLARFVFDYVLRNRMEFTQTIPFVENYIAADNLQHMYEKGQLTLWGVFVEEQLAGVSGMQSDGMITLLYILPQYTGRKFGNKLLQTMREYAKEVLRLSKVTVNAAPAWTAAYFKKNGFRTVNKELNFQVPFVPMQAFSEEISLQKREKITFSTIAWAVVACIGFATIIGIWFMMTYLF